MKKIILIFVLFMLCFAAKTFAADVNISDCTDLNLNDTTYYLNTSFTNSTAINCFNITGAFNSVLDCQGNYINGTKRGGVSAAIYALYKTDTNVSFTIKNCTTTNWWGGIYLQNASNVTIEDVNLGNGTEGLCLWDPSNYNRILRSTFHDTTENMVTSSHHNYFENNTFIRTAVAGIKEMSSSHDNTYYNNDFYTNNDGLSLSYSQSDNITNNRMYNNTRYGVIICCSDVSHSHTLVDNQVYNNQYGIVLNLAGANNTISGGSVYNNTLADYYVIKSYTSNVFINTNFASPRTIRFWYYAGQENWFNYADDAAGLIRLITGNVSYNTMTRTINSWTQNNVSWNDSLNDGTNTTNYTLNGLYPNTVYNIYNFSQLAYTLTSDSLGGLSFAIDLNATSRVIEIDILPCTVNVTFIKSEANYTNQNLSLFSNEQLNISTDGDSLYLNNQSTTTFVYIESLAAGDYKVFANKSCGNSTYYLSVSDVPSGGVPSGSDSMTPVQNTTQNSTQTVSALIENSVIVSNIVGSWNSLTEPSKFAIILLILILIIIAIMTYRHKYKKFKH